MSEESDRIIENAVDSWLADDIKVKDVVVNYHKNTIKKASLIIICLVLAFVFAGFAVTIGDLHVGFFDSYKVIFDHLKGNITDDTADYIIWEWRLPRVLTGLIAGAGLGIAGAVMQCILRNPLADPYTTGISSGASLGASIAIGFGITIVSGVYGTVVTAFVFSLIPMAIIMAVSKMKGATPTVMIMAGIAVMYIFNACTTLIKLWVDPDKLEEIFKWSVGTIDGAKWEQVYVMFAVVFVGYVILQLLARRLNVLSTGDESSRSIGVNANRLRLLCMFVVSMITAGVVSFTGLIGFIGLVSPHIVRLVIGSDNRFLIPASGAFGAALLILADTVGRTIIEGTVIQVGVITAFIGGPMFLYLILRQRKEEV
jgi:iron complex transport system permease protein